MPTLLDVIETEARRATRRPLAAVINRCKLGEWHNFIQEPGNV